MSKMPRRHLGQNLERGVETSVLPALRELKIGFVPYSPLGRGFLSGTIKTFDDLPADDWRRTNPRFSKENFAQNFELVNEVKSLADRVKATPAQVALAWILKQGENIVPIPGTKRLSYLQQNSNATFLKITPEQWAPLEAKLKTFKPYGDRYTADMMKLLDQ